MVDPGDMRDSSLGMVDLRAAYRQLICGSAERDAHVLNEKIRDLGKGLWKDRVVTLASEPEIIELSLSAKTIISCSFEVSDYISWVIAIIIVVIVVAIVRAWRKIIIVTFVIIVGLGLRPWAIVVSTTTVVTSTTSTAALCGSELMFRKLD